jgi:hypothetical protein
LQPLLNSNSEAGITFYERLTNTAGLLAAALILQDALTGYSLVLPETDA